MLTLFLIFVATVLALARLALSLHEAAHAVMAWRDQQGTPESLRVGLFSGSCGYDGDLSTQRGALWYCTVSMAGAVGLSCVGRLPLCLPGLGCRSDLESASEEALAALRLPGQKARWLSVTVTDQELRRVAWLYRINSLEAPEERVLRVIALCIRHAERMLTEDAATVKKVARAMWFRHRMAEDELRCLLGPKGFRPDPYV